MTASSGVKSGGHVPLTPCGYATVLNADVSFSGYCILSAGLWIYFTARRYANAVYAVALHCVRPSVTARYCAKVIRQQFLANISPYLRNSARRGRRYYGTLKESRMRSIVWYYFH